MTDMFTPGRIGNLELKNRVVRSATWEALADEEGRVTGSLIGYTLARIRGEVGLYIMGITAVSRNGLGMPGMTGMFNDEHVESHQRLTEAVHEEGGTVALQIAHVGAQASEELLGTEAVAPSAVLHPSFQTMPRALSTDEVKQMVEAFGTAARRAAQAGYDAVQIHAAHGYLLDQFMSPLFNQREDEYGEPSRFPLEVYDAVRKNAGDLPVLVKLSLDDFYPGSTTPDVALQLARDLDRQGIDAIEVSAGIIASGKYSPSRSVKEEKDEGYFLELTRMAKKNVSCPVIAVGGFRSPEVIDRVLAAGDADFVSISRPLIREPRLVKRWSEGDREKPKCISCNRCFGTLKYGEGIQCMMELRERRKEEQEKEE
ncbi:MAG: NADH:flavin oxidoreductase [bacterium]